MNQHDLIDKLFKEYDKDNTQTISKFEFPNLMRGLFDILGNEMITNEDIDDPFYQLDINGDHNISKVEMMVLA